MARRVAGVPDERPQCPDCGRPTGLAGYPAHPCVSCRVAKNPSYFYGLTDLDGNPIAFPDGRPRGQAT
jgi:hypothetical protein